MNNIKYIFIVIILTITSCSKQTEQYEISNTHTSDVIPIEEALANLRNTVVRIYGETKADSYTFDVDTFGNNDLAISTKSLDFSIPDTLMYLVNFNQNNGFAVLSANRQLNEDIYCITESGNISKDDFADSFNCIAAATTKSNVYAIEDMDEQFEEIGSAIIPRLIVSAMLYDLADEELSAPIIETKLPHYKSENAYGPWLETKWKQTGPFNDLTDRTPENLHNDDDWPCGCTTIAAAQIINYHKIPVHPVFNGVKCNWDTLGTIYNYKKYKYAGSESAQNQAANFLYVIGSKDYCNTEYTATSGGAYVIDAKRAFKNLGYNDLNRRIGCTDNDIERIIDHIKLKKPVMMSGFTSNADGYVGHTWVIDGTDGNYLHINWGWNGDCDGYFVKGNFNTKKTRQDSGMDFDGSPYANFNFTWTFRYLTYSI